MPGIGVQRITYQKWLEGRPGELVWHGRINGGTPSSRAQLVAEALPFVGRPYDFWDWVLDSTTGFYCSKLAWLSAFRAINLAIDNDANTRRTFWVSPKQLLEASNVVKLFIPSGGSSPY
jgi:uncharacterized protein YycO